MTGATVRIIGVLWIIAVMFAGLLALALLVPAAGGPLAVHEIAAHSGLSTPGWIPAGRRDTWWLAAVLGTLIVLLLVLGGRTARSARRPGV